MFLTSLMNSLRLRRSSAELKWILCIILFQSFIDLIFIRLEPNIWVLVLGILSKYCCDPLVLRFYSSLKGLKNWSKTSRRLLAGLSKTNRQFFRMILFFKLLIFRPGLFPGISGNAENHGTDRKFHKSH